jgi:hypothetical protein
MQGATPQICETAKSKPAKSEGRVYRFLADAMLLYLPQKEREREKRKADYPCTLFPQIQNPALNGDRPSDVRTAATFVLIV